jgi:hypothetical protein
MEVIKEKLSNGNTIEYKIINGTAYHKSILLENGVLEEKETPDEVIKILEKAMHNSPRKRIRVFYGDSKTGKDWKEEHGIIGYIGRSTGRIKIPLIINNSQSKGGPALLDNCIVKITVDKVTVYKHKNYYLGELTITEANEDLKAKGYNSMVFCDGENQANFKTEQQAKNYIAFLKGERNTVR